MTIDDLISKLQNIYVKYEKLISYACDLEDEICNLNGEIQRLNNILNETIEYLKYQLSCLDFEKDIKARMLCSMTIVMLEQKELKESDK